MRAKEILKQYPVGCVVTDCFDQKDCTIMNRFISISEFKPLGTIVLGHQHIYDPLKNKWATIQKVVI